MKMGDSIIEMEGSLKQIQLENMMIQKIRNELCESFVTMQDVDLIRQICCTIEDMASGQKINKLELFMKIHRSCFGQMDEKEIQTVTNIIKYLNDNKKLKRVLCCQTMAFFNNNNSYCYKKAIQYI
jgi:hypothetical protein